MTRELKYAAARKLRVNQTDAEKLLWGRLRARQLQNYKFRRQQPLGPYVVDFVCQQTRLVIELDGGQHQEQENADALRTAFLISQGYRVSRFWNNEVMANLDGVLQQILELLAETPHPSPLPQGERGRAP